MSEKYINLSNIFLYYVISPFLLLYFTLIDIGFVKCSLAVLSLFAIAITAGIIITVVYKKKNLNYKFNVNESYGKVMCALVLLELAYSLSK